jgi:hypothetical protein
MLSALLIADVFPFAGADGGLLGDGEEEVLVRGRRSRRAEERRQVDAIETCGRRDGGGGEAGRQNIE